VVEGEGVVTLGHTSHNIFAPNLYTELVRVQDSHLIKQFDFGTPNVPQNCKFEVFTSESSLKFTSQIIYLV